MRGQDAPSYQVELEKFNTEADPNDMREPSPETSDLQIIADAVSDITKDGESRGNVDFLVLLLQELQSMPSITDDFRVRCLRFLREERKRMEWTSAVHSNHPISRRLYVDGPEADANEYSSTDVYVNKPYDYAESLRSSVASSVVTDVNAELEQDVAGRVILAGAEDPSEYSSSAAGGSSSADENYYDEQRGWEDYHGMQSSKKVARAGPMEMSSSDDDQSDGSVNAWGSDDPNIDTAENKRLSRAENENIIKELQRKLIEIGHEKLSDASIARICKHVQREIRAKYDAPSGAWAPSRT